MTDVYKTIYHRTLRLLVEVVQQFCIVNEKTGKAERRRVSGRERKVKSWDQGLIVKKGRKR